MNFLPFKTKIGLVLFWAAGICACSYGDIETEDPSVYAFSSPSYFPAPAYHFSTNPITKDGFKLGRKLFYETRLSSDHKISCGSCHIQTAAFTHHGHATSHGIFDRLGVRNAPPIMNLAWQPSFMWDGGIPDLDLQPIDPITNPVEMDNNIAAVLRELREDPQYQDLFYKAFGTSEITSARLLKALSQFMLLCASDRSKYDSVMRKEAGARFTEEESRGRILVRAKCGACHAEPLFTDYSFRNNGLNPSKTDDKGRYRVTEKAEDMYKFKVPSLRNLAYTSPYMHDGRFLTLEATLEHYALLKKDMPTLDTALKRNGKLGIPLGEEEKKDIVAFLKTLNDRHFLYDNRFSEP